MKPKFLFEGFTYMQTHTEKQAQVQYTTSRSIGFLYTVRTDSYIVGLEGCTIPDIDLNMMIP